MARTDIAAAADARPSRSRSVVALLVGILGVALLFALGTWQVERLHWKEGILRQIDERTHSPPQAVDAIADIAKLGGDVDYYPVAARGRFLNAAERFFLSTFGGDAGWNVYVPMDLGGNRFVWVNRGFVPYDRKDPSTRRAGLVEGGTDVAGLARNVATEKASWLVPNNDVAKNQFFWKNLAEMGVGTKLPPGAAILPFVIDAGPGRAPGGWPVGGTTVIDIPNNHLQYAITWYALALALAAMLGYQVYRAFRPAPGEPKRG